MNRDIFKFHFDSDTQITYVKKEKDEQTKNHREADSEVQTGFMLQVLDSNRRPHKLCPVCSFENYLCHLNPNSEALWQTPKRKVKDNEMIWYTQI